jgi:cytochrome c peroxidase
VSIGVHGRTGTRNAPPLINLAWNTSFFWDGGVKTLEQQAVGPITNPLEMDMTMGEVVQRASADPEYVRLSRAAYGSELRPEVVTKGIASFMRSLVSGKSRYDRYLEGDAAALNTSEKRGADIALGERGDCFHCHVGFNLTNNTFANNGLVSADTGRTRITEKAEDEGKFKVPTLRNVALTAPYMHDGSLATLRDVIEFYSRGGQGHRNTDPTIRPLNLSGQEKEDLLAFLGSLTDEGFVKNPRFAP